MLLALLFGDELQNLAVDLVLLEIDGRDAILLREKVRDLGVALDVDPSLASV